MEVTTAALAKQLLSPTPCYKGNLTLTGVYRLARGGFFFCLITAASPGIVLLMEICARASEMCHCCAGVTACCPGVGQGTVEGP